MNLKVSILALILMGASVYIHAQSARNPLNFEPVQVALHQGISSWKLSEEQFFLADGTPYDKRSHFYDEQGKKKSDVTAQWNKNEASWQTKMEREFLYAAGKEITITQSNRQNASKTETVLNAAGKPLYAFTYAWNKDADDWSLNHSVKSEWSYNAKGAVTARYNDTDTRILYRYDVSGALVEETFQSWNPASGQWTDQGRYTYTKDNKQQTTAVSSVIVAGEWVTDSKTVYLYDAEGKLARCNYFRKISDEKFDAYSLYTYSEGAVDPATVESSAVSIYPNPAESYFEMTVSGELVGNWLYLFDAFGSQVKSLPVTAPNMTVDVTGHKSGIYVLKIKDITKKLVIR